MKQITFASFKGGAGKTTAVMAITSALNVMGRRVALIDADENFPLVEWKEKSQTADTWSDMISVFEADDLRSFEKAFGEASASAADYAIIDTRGGGSELNNACLINTNLVIIPSALTQLDMTQALSTFEHVIELHQTTNVDIPTQLLFQRVPVGKLTVSQRQDLDAMSDLPSCKARLHSRDAFASLGKRGLLHRVYAKMKSDPLKQISASHMATAMDEACAVTNNILAALGEG